MQLNFVGSVALNKGDVLLAFSNFLMTDGSACFLHSRNVAKFFIFHRVIPGNLAI